MAEVFSYGTIKANLVARGYGAIDPSKLIPQPEKSHTIPNKEKVVPFIEENIPRVVEMIDKAKPYSFQEYLGYAMMWGMRTLSEGNYGIGALYIFNHQGEEWLIAGRNGLATDMDTSKHAEMDAIDAVESIARGEDSYKDRVILRRKAKDDESRKMIMTSLDPCPMCRVRIHNHNAPTVMVGLDDSIAGAFVGDNRNNMPPLWNIIMDVQGTRVSLASDDVNSDSYVDPQYLPMIKQMFELNREDIDKALASGELSNVSGPAMIAAGLIRLFGESTGTQETVFNEGIKEIRKLKQ